MLRETAVPARAIPTTLSDHVCVDFVNSAWADHLGSGAWYDRLDARAWQLWFAGRCGIPAPAPPSPATRRRLDGLRERLRELLTSARRPSRADLAYLNAILARQARTVTLVTAGGGYELVERSRLEGWPAVMVAVVESYAELLTRGLLPQVRVCANPDCSWLFVDESRGQRRRWCDVAVCGNLMRVRKFRRGVESDSARNIVGSFMTVTQRWLTIVAAGGCVLVLAGCGSGVPPAALAGRAGGFAVFTGRVSLAGEVHLEGLFADTITGRHESCAEYASGSLPATTLWVTPSPGDAEPVASHVVTMTAGVAPSLDFRGPGRYGAPAAQVDDLVVDGATFIAGDAAATVITLNPNASGQMAFSGLVDTYTNDAESGSVTWTCADSTQTAAGAPTSASPALTTTGLRLSGTVSITGAYTVTTGFSTLARTLTAPGASAGSTASCAEFAAGTRIAADTTAFLGPQVESADASAAAFDVVVDSGFHGPGTYSESDTPGLGGVVEVTIPPASAPQYDTFTSRRGADTQLSVAANGSGHVAFSHWYRHASDSYISGTFDCTCSG